MNERDRNIWIVAATIVAAQFIYSAFIEHRRLQNWLREWETAMSDRREELRDRLLMSEGLTNAEDRR